MDYKELLIKYMAQVAAWEGVHFLPTDYRTEVEFTEQEKQELLTLSEQPYTVT